MLKEGTLPAQPKEAAGASSLYLEVGFWVSGSGIVSKNKRFHFAGDIRDAAAETVNYTNEICCSQRLWEGRETEPESVNICK